MKWITETALPPPKMVTEAGESGECESNVCVGMDVDSFLAAASQGHAIRWTGDFHKAKEFLKAVDRAMAKKAKGLPAGLAAHEIFYRHRQSQAHKANIQSRLLIRVEPTLEIRLPRAPDLREAFREALSGAPTEPFDISLRELLGIIGAHEWRKRGVLIPALGERIFPHYGVFAPVRGEYLDLVAQARIPKGAELGFDIGVGTGVIAAILAKRGLPRVVGTDCDARAVECARANIARLGMSDRIDIRNCDLFPDGVADLIVCNPPWLPLRPTSRLEGAIYDPGSRVLRGFLDGVRSHLTDRGEVWLVISNFAELLGLRASGELAEWIDTAGLKVIDRLDTKPKHSKAQDETDPLFAVRSREITSLYVLAK